jgi:salicylate hydroxylase
VTENTIAIAGGGIGGMAAALACARAGRPVRVFERASAFEAIGAGVQLGPNVTRLLQGWGLADALRTHAAFVQRLQVKRATDGAVLATLPLGEAFAQRYGAPYVTLHRGDLHTLLADAANAAGAQVQTGSEVADIEDAASHVSVRLRSGAQHRAAMLIAADGLNSRIRAQLLGDGAPRATGHLAFRALVAQDALPAALRQTVGSDQVTVWLGPRLHVVQYPVRAGRQLNLVAFIHGAAQAASEWDNAATVEQLKSSMAGTAPALQTLLQAAPAWRLWVMYDRAPLTGPAPMARGRIALLGDAAHPMRPYLAQGAGMAIEDAAVLANVLSEPGADVAAQLAAYANLRWRRNARVQARALRNGQIFHATGALRWGRDLSLRMLGAPLLDMPWLYGFDAIQT